MIKTDRIARDGFPTIGIEIWEREEYLGRASELDFETVDLKDSKAIVLEEEAKPEPRPEKFVVALPRRAAIPRFRLQVFSEIVVPEGCTFSLWLLNIVQAKRHPLMFVLINRNQRRLLFYEAFFDAAFYSEGEPLFSVKEKEPWIAQFAIGNRSWFTARRVGGYCLISLEKK